MSNDLLLEDNAWFKPAREALLESWLTKTAVASPDDGEDSLACSLVHAVKKDAGHLSIACSLDSEADQIEKLLKTTGFDDDPVFFFRVFLFLFDEFTARLEECYRLLKHKPVPKQPELISVWTNRYAKHRTAILIQHHAQHLFRDDPKNAEAIQKLNVSSSVTFIDTDWLKANRKADPVAANQNRHAVVIVPPLIDLQSAAIEYFIGFRNVAYANANQLEQFQSPHHLNILSL